MRFGVEVLATNLYECVLHSIYRTGAMSSNYLSCYPLVCRRKTLRPRTSSNFTDLHIITLPRIPGEVDTEERAYIYMQITMEALLAVFLTVMGYFHCHPRVVRILSWSCRITPQSNSPMPVLPTMQSDDVRQENMATVLNIPLKYFCQMLQKKAIYPLNNCRTPGFYCSLFLV